MKKHTTPQQTPATWAQLLKDATEKPGTLAAAYRAFHSYSVGNQLLAMFQCSGRGLQAGPIATFPAWKAKGRNVRKGEKAITLCMPVTFQKPVKKDGQEEGDEQDMQTVRAFMYRPHWFVLAQTDGEDVTIPPVPGWDRDKAAAALEITIEPFSHSDGNCQGYAYQHKIAVSPLAAHPMKTYLHELAHVVLGHTADAGLQDTPTVNRNERECEAEAVSMLVADALELPGVEESRGYIQNWYGQHPIPEKMAQKIINTADKILKAGRE